MTSRRGGATVYAVDLQRMAHFYATVCGLVEQHRDADFVVLAQESLQLVLVQVPPRIARTITIATPPQRREDTAVKLAFMVSSIAQARAAAPACGGVIDGPQQAWVFQDARVCDGHDPEGNVIQVREAAD